MAGIIKFIPTAKKLVEILDKHGWKRLSGVVVVIFTAGWLAVLSTILSYAWTDGGLRVPPAWCVGLLTGIFIMIVITLVVHSTAQTLVRVFAIWILKGDADKLLELKPEERTENGDQPVTQ